MIVSDSHLDILNKIWKQIMSLYTKKTKSLFPPISEIVLELDNKLILLNLFPKCQNSEPEGEVSKC